MSKDSQHVRNMHERMAAGNGNVAAPSTRNVNDPSTGSGGFLPARHVRERYRVSDMTIWRWLRDDSVGFPQPVYLGRYRYWRVSDIEAWEVSQAKKGAAA